MTIRPILLDLCEYGLLIVWMVLLMVDLIAIWLKVYTDKIVDVELCLMINKRWVGWWYFGVIYVMFGVIVEVFGMKERGNDLIDGRIWGVGD